MDKRIGGREGCASAQGRHFFLLVSLCDIKEMLPAAGSSGDDVSLLTMSWL